MFRESHNWQPFGPQRWVAAKPHKGSAMRSAMAGGTGCWPSSQKLASAGFAPEAVSSAASAITCLIIGSLSDKNTAPQVFALVGVCGSLGDKPITKTAIDVSEYANQASEADAH